MEIASSACSLTYLGYHSFQPTGESYCFPVDLYHKRGTKHF